MKIQKWIQIFVALLAAWMLSACGGGGGGGGTNTPPVAAAQSVTADEDTPKSFTLSGTDADGDTLTYTITANPAHGTLTGSAPNLTYTPAANYNGSDSFKFKVNDGAEDSAEATVSITVSAVNDAPVATSAFYTIDANRKFTLTLGGSDVDGDRLTYGIDTSPSNGTLNCTGASCVYEPTADYTGTDSFTFTANDGTVGSTTATVTFNVQSRPFVIKVKTDNTGWVESASDEFLIKTDPHYSSYDYQVDCGDGNGLSATQTGDYTCSSYTSAGTYTVKIYGQFPAMNLRRHADNSKIIDIVQWGTNRWKSMAYMFFACNNLSYSATDTPVMSDVTDMQHMFVYAVFSADINDWDVSHVENMKYLFCRSNFNGDISDWNTSSVKNMGDMFSDDISFSQDISRWDTSNVTDMYSMFDGASAFNQDIGDWDVSHVTDMGHMFGDAAAFDQDLSDWNISQVADMGGFLSGTAFSQAHYDRLLEKWSTLPVQTGVEFGTLTIGYSTDAAKDGRTKLVRDKQWNIHDANTSDDGDDDGATDDEELRAGTDPDDETVFVFGGLVYHTVKSNITNEIWLDRNLGASQVCTAANDQDCYGDYYQWGRKNAYDGSRAISAQSNNINMTHTVFLQGYKDWVKSGIDNDGSDRQDNWKLKDGNFTCPKHFRVPTASEWDAELGGGQLAKAADAYNKSSLKLPSAGGYNYTNATLIHEGNNTTLWSSDPNGNNEAKVLDADSSAAQVANAYRAYGFPVRCIQDINP